VTALDVIPLFATVALMEDQQFQQQSSPTIRDLHPILSGTQRKEAEANLRRYVEIVDEIRKEQAVRGADFDIVPNPTRMKERSNVGLKT
jgi:hypothetical protein